MKKNSQRPTSGARLRRHSSESEAARHEQSESSPTEDAASRPTHEVRAQQRELEQQIEELKQVRHGLELALAKYQDLYQNAPIGYITLDRSGLIREANLAATLSLRRERKRLVGRGLSTLVDRESRPACEAFLEALRGQGDRHQCEVVIATAGTRPSTLHLDGRRVGPLHNPETRVVLMDVTANRQTEQALRSACEDLERQVDARNQALDDAEAGLMTSESRLARVQQIGKLAVWEYDAVNERAFWSEELFDLLEMERTRSVPSLDALAGILHPDDAVLLSPDLLHEYLRAPQINIRCRVFCRDRRAIRHVHVWGTAARDAEGNVVMLSGTVRDVTEEALGEEKRLRMDRQLLESQKMGSVGLMAGGVAHDFNNLLQGVLGNVELAMLEADPSSPVIHRLEEIEATSLRLSELTRRLLAYSGRAPFFIEPVSLNQVVEDTSRLLAISLPKKAVVSRNLAENLPAVEGDTAQLGQVVMNLVINGAEALGDDVGSVSLRTGISEWQEGVLTEFRWSQKLHDGRYVCLEVADTGCGIDLETQERFLEPFFSTKSAGRGLGLSAVLAIVSGHGGALGFSSVPGSGTTFRVLLPESTRMPIQSGPPSHVRELWRSNGLVLVADDEPEVQRMAAAMLKRLGFEVLVVGNGRAAVEIMAERGEEIGLVILDFSMPVMDGLEAMAEIHGAWPEARVILSSGYAEQDMVDRHGQCGFAAFLQKPYALGSLIDVVRRALNAPAWVMNEQLR